MYVVMTKVKLKPGKVDEVLELFRKTNPDLVKGQSDWVRAKFTANREEDQVIVCASWNSIDAYQAFSSSDEFQQVMSQFGQYFAGPPEVTIHEVLFEM